MTDYLLAQSVWCVLFALEAAFLVWRYHVVVSRPVRIRAFRQRLFALRDRAILLVAEDQAKENDPDWQMLYRALNHSAKAASVGEMKNGFLFVRKLLRSNDPPSKEDRLKFGQLPPPLLELWADYVVTVFSIVWEGSLLLRLAVRLAHRFPFVKRLFERRNPKETDSYRGWEASADELKHIRVNSPTTPATASI
jgi:hypothetical protein